MWNHHVRWLAAAVLVMACKGNADKTASTAGSGESRKSSGPPTVSNHDLAATPLQPVASTAGAVAFTIELPVSRLSDAEVKDQYATWEVKPTSFDTPTFTVQHRDDALAADATGPGEPIGDDAADRKIVRAEKLPEGGYLNLDARNDHAFYRLELCRPAVAGRLCCSVTQRTSTAMDAFDEIVAFAEKVCRSMKST